MSAPSPMTHTPGPDVVVVGAGLVGCLLTHRLTVRGVRVLLLEADDVGGQAARSRLVLDPGLSGRPDLEAAERSRRFMGILAAQAPHLCQTTAVQVSTPGGWAMHRVLAALGLHDRSRLGPLADARPVSARLGLHEPIALTGHRVDERRLVLALALSAAARGATLRTASRVTEVVPSATGHTVRFQDQVVEAPYVVMAIGGASLGRPEPAKVHTLELLLVPQCSDLSFLDASDEMTVEHLPLPQGSQLRITATTSPTLEQARQVIARHFGDAAVEIHDLRRTAHAPGPTQNRSDAPGSFAVSGSELASAHVEVQRLAHTLAQALNRPSQLDTGDDARLEDGDFEVSPAVERTRLGPEILGAMRERHGERASAIVDRVMRTPREGAVVCPCRMVTEAELRHTHLNEHARDLSALGRRTELGHGACAGVRCAHRAAAILAEQRLDETPAVKATDVAVSFLRQRASHSAFSLQREVQLGELREGMARAAGLPAVVEDPE